MRKQIVSLLVSAILVLSSCSLKVSTSVTKASLPLKYDQEVFVLELDQPTPDSAEVIGTVKIGDAGLTTNCDYLTVIERAKQEARKIGGNAIKIVEHSLPSFFASSCHQITANILVLKNGNMKSTIIPDEPQDLDYAILNIYRMGNYGGLVKYNLYLGDSVLCRVKGNFKTTIHIKKDGLNSLWAKTETKTEIPINIEMGKTYYIRCGIKFGVFVGRPVIELVENRIGKDQFEHFYTEE